LATGEIFGVHFKSALKHWIPDYQIKFSSMDISSVIVSLRDESKYFLLSQIIFNLEAYLQFMQPELTDLDLQDNNKISGIQKFFESLVSC
jgi:hypothetical protein